MSTQAYYKHGDTAMRKLAEEAFCVEYIRRIRQKDRGIGGGKLWRMYRASFGEEHSVGYNRFYDIIDKYGLKVRRRRDRLQPRPSPVPQPGQGTHPGTPQPAVGERHHLYGRLSQWPDGRIHLLLPFSCHRLLHQGDYRLVRRPDA